MVLTLSLTLMGRPELLMVDQPTDGLPQKIVALVAKFMPDFDHRGMGVLLVEQKLTFALDVADRGLLMGHSQVVFQATPADLRADSEIRKVWLAV